MPLGQVLSHLGFSNACMRSWEWHLEFPDVAVASELDEECGVVSVVVMGGGVEKAGEAGGASSSGRVRRRESLPRPPPHTGDCSPLALPLVM
ncbi:jg1291 [Pararge aegeria aegeria]|uniref:Jg1291 protein n=1 Tax=Pararge aegeria aegeria TaxID=348720 RepID=A0A8S4RDQ8_9NEOP|nr:jg1291 [Pararge aegeria aegeria]